MPSNHASKMKASHNEALTFKTPINAPLPPALTPHHIGVATRSIESELPLFLALGFRVEGEFCDERQGVRGVFVAAQGTAKPYRFELLENLPHSTQLNSYLKSHHKLYHIAFESRDIEEDSKRILESHWDFSLPQNANLKQSDYNGGGGGEMKPIIHKNMPNTHAKRRAKARLLVPIMESSYFKKLCFIMLPNRLLIELVELKNEV